MRFVEATGRTEEEAIQAALSELNVSRDRVDVEILESASKGILGLWGSKPAKVKVIVKESKVDKVKAFLEGVIDRMNIKANITVEENGDSILVNFEGMKIGRLIGHRGETLDALQYLTNIVCNRGEEERCKVILDAENYRKKREQALVALALKMADKVKRTRRRVALEPMSAYERRILHTALQDDPDVTTYSEGIEPRRKVIIALK